MSDTNECAGFTKDELLLPYPEWEDLVKQRRDALCAKDKAWLFEWFIWDHACSPMDDKERRTIRYGHYLGWVARGNA